MLSDKLLADPETLTKITVTITDHAALAPLVLLDAGNQAAHLLSRAGVQTEWRLCLKASERPATEHRPCAEAGPLTLAVRIVDAKSPFAGRTEESCGFALTDRSGKPGRLAIVNADCAARVSPPGQKAFAAVLGHIITHEIGHLLLGPASHSAGGLMSAKWTKHQKILLLQNQLHFTEQESARMLEAVRVRARGQPIPAHAP